MPSSMFMMTKPVVVMDFLPLISLSFTQQSPQLIIIGSTAVSACSSLSVRLRDVSQAESLSTVQLPNCCLRKHRFPMRVPSQPLPYRTPFLPSHRANAQLQTPFPVESARCLTLNRNKRLPQMGIFFFFPNGNLLNRIVNGLQERTLCSLSGRKPACPSAETLLQAPRYSF